MHGLSALEEQSNGSNPNVADSSGLFGQKSAFVFITSSADNDKWRVNLGPFLKDNLVNSSGVLISRLAEGVSYPIKLKMLSSDDTYDNLNYELSVVADTMPSALIQDPQGLFGNHAGIGLAGIETLAQVEAKTAYAIIPRLDLRVC